MYSDFLTYAGGVYTHKTGTELGGHAIKIIGWGVTSDGTEYWEVSIPFPFCAPLCLFLSFPPLPLFAFLYLPCSTSPPPHPISSPPALKAVNSWNVQWGVDGGFLIARGTDECGIEDDLVGGLA